MIGINSVVELNDFYDSLDYEFSEDFEIKDSEDSEILEDDLSFSPEDVSSNSESISEDSSAEDVSSNDSLSTESENVHFRPSYDLGGDYLNETKSELADPSSYDYTLALEDIKTVGVFLIALLLGLFLGFAFIKGFSSKNEC